MQSTSNAQEFVDEVDGDMLWGHFEAFAKWVKLSGMPEERKSLDYVQATLKDYGYDTEVITHEAYISLPGDASIVIDGNSVNCITQSFSQPSPDGGLVAPIVDVGAGQDEDFSRVNAKDCIILVDGIATPDMACRAARAGAVGEIHISPQELLHEMCISPIWGSPGLSNRDQLPKTVVVTIPKSLGLELRQTLLQRQPSVALNAKVDTGWRPIPLLKATLDRPGAPDDDPYVMFSGHHDTWYLGVMDNGGANATMLEVARIISTRRAQMVRGLRLFFWSGHSHGRYAGSTWYADQHFEELADRAVAHVNIDSTGARGNTVLTDVQSSAELKGLAGEAIAAESDQTLMGFRIARAGDQSFWGIGVPSTLSALGEQPADGGPPIAGFLFSGARKQGAGLGWWWHTPEDTLDKMDRDIAVRDTRIYLRVVWALLSNPILPLNYQAYADYLNGVLTEIEAALAGRFELTEARELSVRLDTLAGELATTGSRAHDEDTIQGVNAALMTLSRGLVRLDYTEGDAFTQDPALPQNPFPSLDPLRALAETSPDSDDEKFARIDAVRGYRRFRHVLSATLDAVEIQLNELTSKN